MSTEQAPASPSPFQRPVVQWILVLLAGLIVVATYFSPLFNGKSLKMDDIVHFQGMSKESVDYIAKGENPLWNGRVFGGMPTYQMGAQYSGDLLSYPEKVLMLFMPRPLSYFWLLFAGMVFLLGVMGTGPLIAGTGGIAYALSSYFMVAMSAGHASKIVALGYIAPMIAAIFLVYKGHRILGAALTALFVGLELHANHIQITYYFAFVLLFLFVALEIHSILVKKHKAFLISTAFVGVGALIGVGPNVGRLWTTYEYQKETMRGGAVLSAPEGAGATTKNKSGLDSDYAFQWSYGVGETMTLLIPNYYGGSSSGRITAGGETKEILQKAYGKKNAEILSENWPTYFGTQPFTSGPVYVGAIVIFLSLLGLLMAEGWLRWSLLGVTLLTIALSWGKNALGLSMFFFESVPLYNKFRAVSMILVVAEFTLPLIGFYGLFKFLQRLDLEGKSPRNMFSLYVAAGISGLTALVVAGLAGSIHQYAQPDDAQTIYQMLNGSGLTISPQGADNLASALASDRQSMVQMDALRSFGLILGAFLALMAVALKRIPKEWAIAGIAGLVLVDMYFVDKRYLNDDNFIPEKNLKAIYQPSPADQSILQDPSLSYRVLNITVSPFQDAKTSYFHKSIGGYNPAKLRRYQDMIDIHFMPEIQALTKGLSSSPNADSVLASLKVLNMMNMRYLIYNPQAPALPNRHAYGNAWFVREVKVVSSADEEIQELRNINPRSTALIHSEFQDQVQGLKPQMDSTASIRLTEYNPNHLTYQSNTTSEQLAIFSEVYYSKGWNAYIDQQPASWFRANYILRGMRVPAGTHTLEFKFEPKSFETGNSISLIMSLVIFIATAFGLYLAFFRKGGNVPFDDDSVLSGQ